MHFPPFSSATLKQDNDFNMPACDRLLPAQLSPFGVTSSQQFCSPSCLRICFAPRCLMWVLVACVWHRLSGLLLLLQLDRVSVPMRMVHLFFSGSARARRGLHASCALSFRLLLAPRHVRHNAVDRLRPPRAAGTRRLAVTR